MSDFEMLLTAWLSGGEIPADFKPSSNVEEYLLAILNGVDDDVDPKSRADVLLDAIAAKYAGYAEGLSDLRDVTGMTEHHAPGGDTPEEVAAFLRLLNTLALQDLAAKGATGVNANTTDILDAYANLPSGGASLNIAYGNTAPEDTTKLWVKTAQPQNVTVDYDIDNGVESITPIAATLPDNTQDASCCAVGTKCYIFGGKNTSTNALLNKIKVFDTTTRTIETLSATLPNAERITGCGAVGTKCYIFGGSDNYVFLNTIQVFDAETSAVSTLTATLPRGAGGVACGVVGSKIYLFGGVAAGGYRDEVLKTINVFDAETETITPLSVTLPTAAWGLGVGVVGTNIYLFGGIDSGAHAIWKFDTETNTLTSLSATLPATAAIVVASVGTKCYLFGYGTTPSDGTIYCFDATSETLTTLTDTFPRNIVQPFGSTVGTSAYIFDGYSTASSSWSTDTYKFTVTFPLNEGDVYLQSDVFKNKFTIVAAPTEVKTGVSAVYVGNASNEAEYAEARLYNSTSQTWELIT